MDLLDIISDLQKRQTYIDAVSVEDTGERRRNDDGYTACFDGDRCMFARGAAAEVFTADHDVAGLDIFREGGVYIHHAVLGQFLRIEGIQVTGRNDDVRVDVVAVAPNLSF